MFSDQKSAAANVEVGGTGKSSTLIELIDSIHATAGTFNMPTYTNSGCGKEGRI